MSRGSRAGDQDRADNQISQQQVFPHCVRVAENRVDIGRHHFIEISKAVEIDIHDDDIGPQPRRHSRGLGSDNAAAENHHVRRRDAGNPAKEDSAPIMGFSRYLAPS